MIAEARQSVIRRTLHAQYAQGAVNEGLVARLRAEMTKLPHRHHWIPNVFDYRTSECMFCNEERLR